MNDREYIGKRIAQIRKKRGLSQLELSELSGIGRAHIVRIEQGKYSTGIDTLFKISNALKVNLDFIA